MSTWGNSQAPSGTPATPPTRNGTVRRQTKPRRTVPMDRSCPNHEPHTTSGPASCGSIAHAHTLTATSPNAKPDTPCTKPPRHVPPISATIMVAVIDDGIPSEGWPRGRR